MTSTERTIARILAILERQGYVWPGGKPPADLRIDRTRAGRLQREAGAWSWRFASDSTAMLYLIGSQYPASEVATWDPEKARLHRAYGDITIYPC